MTAVSGIDLSVVVAVYNEDPRNLLALNVRLNTLMKDTGVRHEVIFVNDGSRSRTSTALRQIAAQERNNIKLIELSRNFGQQAAITCGLEHSEGAAVVNMDSDLQDPPELIADMLEKWMQGYDVVYATRSKRNDRFLKRSTAFLFYRILGAMSIVDIPWDTGDFRLMDRKVVDALNSMPEKSRFIRGLIPWLGFRQCGIPLERDAREVGESSYTLKKLLSLALEGLLAFSQAPLILLPLAGSILMTLSFIVFVGSLVSSGFEITNFALLAGFATLASLQIIATGLVSVYLSKVLDEARGRPTYVVARRIGHGFYQSSSGAQVDGREQINRRANIDFSPPSDEEIVQVDAANQTEVAPS